MATVSTDHKEKMEGVQDGHAECKPEVLLANDADTIRVPRVLVDVIAVAEYDEDPGGCHAGP
jgi:hypothetical protein